jgi:hypothetical protein
VRDRGIVAAIGLVATGLSTRSKARRATMGAAGLRIRKRRLHRVPRAEARCAVMPATGLRIRKRCLHRVPRGRSRYRTAMADTTRAAMPRAVTGCSDANSCCATRACSAPGANACASCSSPCSGASSASTPAAAAAASTTATASEQRAGCCDQQCRYDGYGNKLRYSLHDDLLFVVNSVCTAEQRNRRGRVP